MKVSWKNCTLNIIRKFFHTEIVGFTNTRKRNVVKSSKHFSIYTFPFLVC